MVKKMAFATKFCPQSISVGILRGDRTNAKAANRSFFPAWTNRERGKKPQNRLFTVRTESAGEERCVCVCALDDSSFLQGALKLVLKCLRGIRAPCPLEPASN